jgi:hypothetical protein
VRAAAVRRIETGRRSSARSRSAPARIRSVPRANPRTDVVRAYL